MADRPTKAAVVVDRELCLGAGMCILYAPRTFAHDAESKAVVMEPPNDPLSEIRNAVDACPMGAIGLLPGREEE
ncbi:ferredoxin [Streptomyces sp. NPDC090075]|uniref:ferredoxin n=1 Tax=Streptomyces sp. NPDC090075 TaxID=3365937 RepID=UPI00380E8FBC